MNYLIAGLGNIGPEYELTRHNIGFLALDYFANKNKINFSLDKLALKTEFNFKGKTFHLIKPTTYMNLSGKAVAYWMQNLKIPIENIFILCDDLNLSFGAIRMRSKGSSGGQNGLNSINETLGNENYARMRLGIGNDFARGQQANYVLGRFSKPQNDELPFIFEKTSEAILTFGLESLDKAMNKFNTK